MSPLCRVPGVDRQPGQEVLRGALIRTMRVPFLLLGYPAPPVLS